MIKRVFFIFTFLFSILGFTDFESMRLEKCSTFSMADYSTANAVRVKQMGSTSYSAALSRTSVLDYNLGRSYKVPGAVIVGYVLYGLLTLAGLVALLFLLWNMKDRTWKWVNCNPKGFCTFFAVPLGLAVLGLASVVIIFSPFMEQGMSEVRCALFMFTYNLHGRPAVNQMGVSEFYEKFNVFQAETQKLFREFPDFAGKTCNGQTQNCFSVLEDLKQLELLNTATFSDEFETFYSQAIGDSLLSPDGRFMPNQIVASTLPRFTLMKNEASDIDSAFEALRVGHARLTNSTADFAARLDAVNPMRLQFSALSIEEDLQNFADWITRDPGDVQIRGMKISTLVICSVIILTTIVSVVLTMVSAMDSRNNHWDKRLIAPLLVLSLCQLALMVYSGFSLYFLTVNETVCAGMSDFLRVDQPSESRDVLLTYFPSIGAETADLLIRCLSSENMNQPMLYSQFGIRAGDHSLASTYLYDQTTAYNWVGHLDKERNTLKELYTFFGNLSRGEEQSFLDADSILSSFNSEINCSFVYVIFSGSCLGLSNEFFECVPISQIDAVTLNETISRLNTNHCVNSTRLDDLMKQFNHLQEYSRYTSEWAANLVALNLSASNPNDSLQKLNSILDQLNSAYSNSTKYYLAYNTILNTANTLEKDLSCSTIHRDMLSVEQVTCDYAYFYVKRQTIIVPILSFLILILIITFIVPIFARDVVKIGKKYYKQFPRYSNA